MNTIKEFEQVREWAEARGLYAKGDVKTQYVKLMEEAGEVARAIIKNDDKEFKDGLGDMVVVLVNLAHIGGTSLEECLALAYAEIKNRTGSMKDGSFVKDEVQKKENKTDKDSWRNTTKEQVVEFFTRKCLDDYQFNKEDKRYCGFINIDTDKLDNEDLDVCMYIINEREKCEAIAKKLGLTISIASYGEIIINEAKQYYKCIGLKEGRAINWAYLFEIGKTYLKIDSIRGVKVLGFKPSEGSATIYVDGDQFELIEN